MSEQLPGSELCIFIIIFALRSSSAGQVEALVTRRRLYGLLSLDYPRIPGVAVAANTRQLRNNICRSCSFTQNHSKKHHVHLVMVYHRIFQIMITCGIYPAEIETVRVTP